MIIAALIVIGLCMGSFVNALTWRIHEQAQETEKKKPNAKYLKQLSISKGRSMCSNCHHELGVLDLIPVLSWLALRGKCRYCGKRIPDSPIVEVGSAALFVTSYIFWPSSLLRASRYCPAPALFHGTLWQDNLLFGLWLVLLVGLLALLVYDIRWMLLPNRLVYPLSVVAALMAAIVIDNAANHSTAALNVLFAVLVGGGIFYVLFQLSGGKWIGGGDVKLGWLLGLVVATPERSLLLIFLAAIGGSIVSVPLLASGKLKKTSTIPFGPFLIVAAVIVQLFGASILHWYQHLYLPLNT
jgi:prepilin signal peptidase PulO-like enzyme (type II secretory pathway)